MPSLHRLDVLIYDERLVNIRLFGIDGSTVLDVIAFGEILVVVGDEDKPFIEVVSPRGKRGWVFYRSDWMIHPEDCAWAKEVC